MRLFIKSGRSPRRKGAIFVWLALSVAVLIGVIALALDGGRMMEERRHAQAAADAAALAAAGDLYVNYWTNHGLDPKGSARAAAETIAAANGYPASALTVNVPPKSGTFAGVAGCVEVALSGLVDASFSKIFARTDLPVQARAVARGQPMKIGMILLRPNGGDAFLNNAPAFALLQGALIVNSNDPAALHQASLGVAQAKGFDVAGNYVNSGGALMLGKIRTGVRPTADPLALLPIPGSASVQSTKPLVVNSVLPTTLDPGVYQGGIHVTGTSAVTMNPGIYIMEGGGFVLDGFASVVGQEVMVYNTIGAYAAGPIQVQSQSKIILIAPKSGTYQGISFFQNRAMTDPVVVSGTGLTTMTGVVYAAGAPAKLTGNAALGLDLLGGAYVVDSVELKGLGGINIDLGMNPPRIPDVRLVE